MREGHTEPGAVDFATARGPEPDDAGLVDWFLTGHAALVVALEHASPDLQCWTFLPAPSSLGFWARRQAHETSIHRVDAELAAGTALSAIEPTFAADGIDELLVGFGSRRGSGLAERGQASTIVDVRCSDDDAGWTVRLGLEEGMLGAAAAGDESAAESTPDCTVRGTGADLYLTLWRRGDPEALNVQGDGRAFELLLERARI